ncbi:MAG TPA: 2-C-methyl-D-erythritol 2,4-cyclodiphosphate synthase, partial [Candidatus Sabulitectum sp.]|nr:2-C-methyl-D-erythritol 2,4-cyclodiphosphate synthase [Candidatus Sabulitectum sp.]
TVIGEKPRISPIRDRLRGRLSELLGVDVSAVWIKGTTTNSIGDLGRGKGVGCHAIAELVKR